MQKREDHNLPQDAFHKACQEGNIGECRELYQNNPDVINQLHSIYQTTGIQWAVQSNHEDLVAWLLKQENIKLFINNSEKHSTTPFRYCVNADIFSLLENAIKNELSTFDISIQVKILFEMTGSLLKQSEARLDTAKA